MVQTLSGGSVVLDVAGVGYLVQVPKGVAAALRVNEPTQLVTTMVVREDAFQLFGFESSEQQGLFDQLRSVSGVGPKTALAIISTLSPAEISRAVTEDDSKPFESVSGVGTKTAKLINVSLSGKIKAHAGNPIAADLLAALQSLGWSEKIAAPVVTQVCASNAGESLPQLIRACLAKLGK
jgi:Holliday junction DNA helicase RuvA